MEIEKLKDMLRNAAGGPVGIQMCQEAADALEQLQAENDRIKKEVQQMRWIPVEERLPESNTGDGYWVAKKGPRGNTMMKLAQYQRRKRKMTDVCGVCCWGPHGTGQCENRTLPPSMRGEGCAWWDLFRRYGEEKNNDKS